MRPVHLSLDKTPPTDVPLRFLLTGPLFGIAAMAAAAFTGPGILLDRWSPQTLAVTHLLVLGYVAMTIFGAQIQLMAVVAGAPMLRARTWAGALHAMLSLGTIGLAAGLAGGSGVAIVVGAGALTAAFGGFALVTARALLGGGQASAPQTPEPAASTAAPEPEPKQTQTTAQAPAASESGSTDGQAIYQKSCQSCHATGVAGAPKLGDEEAWAPRIAKGHDTLFSSVKNGLNAMPPKGTCMSCSDDDLHAAVRYMVNEST